MRWIRVSLAAVALVGCASAGETRPSTPPQAPPEPSTRFTGWQKPPAPDGSLPVEPFQRFVRSHRPDLRHDPWRAARVATGVSAEAAARVSMVLEKRAGPGADAPLAPEGARHVVVVVTKDGLMDDAIAATRHALTFARKDGGWQLVSARMTCRGGRPGSPHTLSAEACFGP